MLDYRLHYGVMLAEDRLREARQHRAPRKSDKRVVRLDGRGAPRDGQR